MLLVLEVMPWIAFLDESGDHGLVNIDPGSPDFALTAIVYEMDAYLDQEIPSICRLKHALWKHEGVIFHCYDIKKKVGPFSKCIDADFRDKLYESIAEAFKQSTMQIVSAVVDKKRYTEKYLNPADVYYMSVKFVLERIYGITGPETTLVFESRGKREDALVRQWVHDISAGDNYQKKNFGFECCFAKKATNVVGLQMADLACEPFIHFTHNKETERPDWKAVSSKIWRGPAGQMEGYGLKTFPK